MSSTPPVAGRQSNRRWLALGLLATAQFMVIMDTSIIGVALPKMQADLGFTAQGLSWVFNAYVVALGGLLLLGSGRTVADRHSPRRTRAASRGPQAADVRVDRVRPAPPHERRDLAALASSGFLPTQHTARSPSA